MNAVELNLFTLWCWLRASRVVEVRKRVKRDYYARNTAVVKARAAAYRVTEKGRTWMRRWMNERRASNPQFKMRQVLSARIWWALNNAGANKTAPTLELLGVRSAEEVWLHLEKQFKPGMSRNNYGKVWEIDHKKPCASFDLTDPEQQKLCFHYTNLQPLFVSENRSKGARVS